MAIISVSDTRALTKQFLAGLTNAEVGRWAAAASVVFRSLADRELGHIVESLTQSGADAVAVCYGHPLGKSGTVMIDGFSGDIDGEYSFERIDRDNVKLLSLTVPSGIVCGKLFPQLVGDFEVLSNRVRIAPGPVAAIVDVRVEEGFPDNADDRFGDDTIVSADRYYLPASTDPVRRCELQLQPGTVHCHPRRVPGFISPQMVAHASCVRVTYYAGMSDFLAMDLASALADVAKQIYTDPSQEFASESFEYYSYSRRSLSDLKSIATSSFATMLKYR